MIEQGLCFVMDHSTVAHTYNNIEKHTAELLKIILHLSAHLQQHLYCPWTCGMLAHPERTGVCRVGVGCAPHSAGPPTHFRPASASPSLAYLLK